MKKILVIAPHPDDETLGCGGTLLRAKESGAEIHWLIITNMTIENGHSNDQVQTRSNEITKVKEFYNFNSTTSLDYIPARLSPNDKGNLIGDISNVINKIKPDTVLVCYRNDAHSDHEVVFDCTMSATKSFRYPFVKKVMAYETISETDYGMKPEDKGFRANVYIDIEKQLDKKIEIMNIFASEMGEFPFPRSEKAIKSLAYLRGSQSNSEASEAFMLIKEII